jgi:hypothetical protein
MKKMFSITDVVVLKKNDTLSYDQLSKIVGGGCVCNCGKQSSANCNGNAVAIKQQ